MRLSSSLVLTTSFNFIIFGLLNFLKHLISLKFIHSSQEVNFFFIYFIATSSFVYVFMAFRTEPNAPSPIFFYILNFSIFENIFLSYVLIYEKIKNYKFCNKI